MKGFVSACYRSLCLLLLVFLPCLLAAQNIPAVSPFKILEQRQEVFSRINSFDDPYKDSLWYDGRFYEFEIKSRQGTPYFFNELTLPGSVTFNGTIHEDLILTYNLILDELILWVEGDRSAQIQLVLNKYFVESFTLTSAGTDYHFRLHTEMKPIHNELKEGFYEVIFDDELQLFVKHHKLLYFDATDSNPNSYKYEKKVYLVWEGSIRAVKNKRTYLKAFPDHKRNLRKYMRKEHIHFEKSGTQSLVELCTYTRSMQGI